MTMGLTKAAADPTAHSAARHHKARRTMSVCPAPPLQLPESPQAQSVLGPSYNSNAEKTLTNRAVQVSGGIAPV